MPRRNFTLFFILALGAAAAGTFFVFSSYARSSVKTRRDASRANLQALAGALSAYATGGAYPQDPAPALAIVLPEQRINPSWPEGPGYVYVSGVSKNDPPETLLLYENVPPQKARMGRLVSLLNGEPRQLEEPAFQERLRAQEELWRASGRRWNPQLLPIP